MILKQLKLAGFKSFVDPVTIPLQAPLVAIVGPNGCGKSNIIDAVRWVMGESAAKSLRGETMTDVIFNGSSHRKPLGQASVELIFDNSMGALSGQYGSYQEIAVKRLVSRDGESIYYLNGTRCRRRDITDIFLGTGAGARSYSIIGQGTISRLIEARPEELRGYLEEAAGISKYKERRRETLQRIAATRENLLRVGDIRDELSKQLSRLEQQAKTAARYKALCEEERRLKSEVLVLKWQHLEQKRATLKAQFLSTQHQFTEHQTRAVEAYQVQVESNLQWTEANDALQGLQTNYYQLTTDIARLEEHIHQQLREKERLRTEHASFQQDCEQLIEQLTADRLACEALEAKKTVNDHQRNTLQNELIDKQAALEILQRQSSEVYEQINASQKALQQFQNTLQLAKTNATHHQQRAQDIKARLQHILSEQSALEAVSPSGDLSVETAQQMDLEQAVEKTSSVLLQSTALAETLLVEQQHLEKTIQNHNDRVYQLSTQLAALQAWIAQALGRESGLSENNPLIGQDQPYWAELIHVDKTWQSVCEVILRDTLRGVVMDDLEAWPLDPSALQGKTGHFITPKSNVLAESRFPRLIDKIQGIRPHDVLDIDKIYAAENWDEALHWLPHLASDESIVTREGYWIGCGWLRILNLQLLSETSLLARQESLEAVKLVLKEVETSLQRHRAVREALSGRIAEVHQEKEQVQQQLRDEQARSAQHRLELANKQRAMEQFAIKLRCLGDEHAELEEKLEVVLLALSETEKQSQDATQAIVDCEAQLSQLGAMRISIQQALNPQEQCVAEYKQQLHTLQLDQQRLALQIEQLTAGLTREAVRLETQKERLAQVTYQLQQLEHPDESLKIKLTDKLHQQEAEAFLLNEKRAQMAALHDRLEASTALNKAETMRADSIKEMIQQLQIEMETVTVKASGCLESLQALTGPPDQAEEILKLLSNDATIEAHEQQLVAILEKIKRLGAINLAAIDEYQTESARKDYLDQQLDDLTEALSLLDAAIVKMDNETRQRFQAMFDEVNQGFQVLFPKLFGGGQARLTLTGENLLEAGVMVMANPPGKRNSTIHLLSGGEKAMTALALIFAIFQLNPSPFCLLDEVDAPLDEVNVGRLCGLMKEMAGVVQFLFITHNKITMQLAEQLIGVTMKELGVSRIVAVDVDQALSMSDTSIKVF